MPTQLGSFDARDRSTVLAHYYRAMVGRADVWRMRMDATTNWAMGATAAVLSFALGNPASPHSVVFIAALMTLGFLLLEARRLTFYHLWQQRVLLLEEALIRPALHATEAQDDASGARADGRPVESGTDGVGLVEALDAGLGRTVPTMSRSKAAARRLRRVYLYVFGVQLLAWILKLSSHPEPMASAGDLLARARVGVIPGEAVMLLTGLLSLAALVVAFRHGGIDRDPA